MEFGGNNNAAFHGYRSGLPQATSDEVAAFLSTTNDMRAPEISMALPPPQQPNPQASAGAGSSNPTAGDENECVVREQDRFMPIANVIRIMRKILPPHAKISDDAKETIQECVSEYISFITSEANDRCQREQRKTITAEDVLWAMSKLGFDDYIEPLTMYLHRYREFDGGDRGSLRGEPLVKRVVDHGFPGFHQSAFHHMAAPHAGFYGATPAQPPPMNLFRDPAAGNAGSSSCMEPPFPQCNKEQL